MCWLCGELYSPGTLEAFGFGPWGLDGRTTLAESPEPSPEPLVTHWLDFPLQTFPLIADLVIFLEVLHTLGRDGQV